MISLYYHLATKMWYHTEKNIDYTLGQTNQVISYQGSRLNDSLPFPIASDGTKLGPLLGILTGAGENSFLGNVSTCRRILGALQEQGALGIVLTPDSFKKEFVDGYYYYHDWRKWIRVRTPLPDLVYNRIPYRYMEETPEYLHTISILRDKTIPFFNPSFFSKWETFQILKKNKFLSVFLPDTILFRSKDDIENMLSKHQTIYVKSTNGHKGLGIYVITLENQGVCVKTIKENIPFENFETFWKEYSRIFTKGDFIIQEAIEADKYNNQRYDLRILCHSLEKSYTISGIGVRLAGKKTITTHIPNGGSIIPYSNVQSRFNETLIEKIANEIGTELTSQIGEFIGEFSIDLGLSTEGQYVIYEVNSKPMVFDEPHIKKQGLENLTKLLIMKAKTT
ncbi:YheC/YheD family protein [Fredinandcohnia sp. 179-A 10B2 NHS]|uniref:YheC/YheD family endospore coat-associated protein n=1 Tax=Fredinandcohnia sp. 179-A 10B2 NHS TaxID=3235176 RepID=UPI00399F136F